MSDHAAIEELLGAYALNAVSPEEAAEVEAHLATCPRCRDEVQSHREVAALLAYAGQPAPAGMWEKVAASLDPPLPEGVARLRRPASPSWRTRLVAVAAAAVVALSSVAAISSWQSSRDAQEAASGRTLASAVAAAATDPGHREAHLDSGGQRLAEVIVLPNGQGYLVNKRLTPLPSGRTYQVWAISGTNTLSVGVPGSIFDFAAITVPPETGTIAVSVERTPGAVAPTAPLASGSLS
jgi:anti-sigma-K factor RskA